MCTSLICGRERKAKKARRNTGRGGCPRLAVLRKNRSTGSQALRMIRIVPEEGVKERFGRRFLAAATRLDRNKHRVNLRQLLGIVKAHHPSAIGFVVHVQNPQVQGQRLLSLRRLLLAPYLEGVGIHNPALAIEIERIKDESFALRVKHPAEWFFRAAAAIHIENIRNIKLSRTH